MPVRKIVSGGQTGADRAALEVARARGIPYGGWVPLGRAAEDGTVPPEFSELRETSTSDPSERTRANLRDSDGTLILSHGALRGGSALTLDVALELSKPVLHVDLSALSAEEAVSVTASWLAQHGIEVLNVAGPRASEDPHIHAATHALLERALARPEPVNPSG
jgi:hypothetical protein